MNRGGILILMALLLSASELYGAGCWKNGSWREGNIDVNVEAEGGASGRWVVESRRYYLTPEDDPEKVVAESVQHQELKLYRESARKASSLRQVIWEGRKIVKNADLSTTNGNTTNYLETYFKANDGTEVLCRLEFHGRVRQNGGTKEVKFFAADCGPNGQSLVECERNFRPGPRRFEVFLRLRDPHHASE
jgi:hypothetical protein